MKIKTSTKNDLFNIEVQRNPEVPKLNDKAIELLTELAFRKEDKLEKVDGIFVFSSCHEIEKLAGIIEDLLDQNISKTVFITGGTTAELIAQRLKTKKTPTEADLLLNSLSTEKHNDVKFLTERNSTMTWGNVNETMKHPEFTKCKKILYIFKSHAGGRGYLTLRKFLPKTTLLQKTFDTTFSECPHPLSRKDWFKYKPNRERVWGEFLRIRLYGGRGDIAYNPVKDLVNKIESETKHVS